MEIYLDANATTSVLEEARSAAMAVMSDDFGNPSSTHGAGLRARALLDTARARARRLLGAEAGEVIFTSGATEGIQTAVLSALRFLWQQRGAGKAIPSVLLYGATEHKAVPAAIRHWNALLGLHLQVLAIPVGRDGRHDLNWLRHRSARAGLVCTMAANNETGVISDLDGIADALADSPALWLVDSVQALGKLPLDLGRRRIDYAPFSGHKLHAPKGVGMLYVRNGAPFTPLLAGGGQEGEQRSGTENMPGIAAFEAVLAMIEDQRIFQSPATLCDFRDRLLSTLEAAFPGVVLNGPIEHCLPTTLNFSVPGVDASTLLDLFDAAEVRVSGGSACNSARAEPSHVLAAMSLPDWQCRSAIRLSFSPTVDAAFIDEASARLRACGAALQQCRPEPTTSVRAGDGIIRLVEDGACCYLIADAESRRCAVIDPLPGAIDFVARWLHCHRYTLAAVLDTHSHGDHVSAAPALRAATPAPLQEQGRVDALGWPEGCTQVVLGRQRITRLPTPGHTRDAHAYLLHDGNALRLAFVGDTVLPGGLGRSDFEQSEPAQYAESLAVLARHVGLGTLLAPGHDYDNLMATTLGSERDAQPLLAAAVDCRMDAIDFAAEKALLDLDIGESPYRTLACGARAAPSTSDMSVELTGRALTGLLQGASNVVLVDVREPLERRMGASPDPGHGVQCEAVAVSELLNALPRWLALTSPATLLFVCRSGRRSAQVARALRRLGHQRSWSISGGMALWNGSATATARVTALAEPMAQAA